MSKRITNVKKGGAKKVLGTIAAILALIIVVGVVGVYNYIDSGAILPIDEYFTDEEKAGYIYWENGKVLGQQ